MPFPILMSSPDSQTTSDPTGIAIVGLAGRFPGADDIQQFWDNLLAARETIRSFGRDELAPGEPVDDPEYIARRGVLDQAEWLDAAFFGISCPHKVDHDGAQNFADIGKKLHPRKK